MLVSECLKIVFENEGNAFNMFVRPQGHRFGE